MSGESIDDGDGRGAEPVAPAPARLRRGVLGYRRTDVDQAIETRDAQLAELREDIAALWLAFGQHDRMIRDAIGMEPQPAPRPAAIPQASDETVAPVESAESINRQLSDLDEVLAAIEVATQTLERTYAEEMAGEPEPDRPDARPESEPKSAGGD